MAFNNRKQMTQQCAGADEFLTLHGLAMLRGVFPTPSMQPSSMAQFPLISPPPSQLQPLLFPPSTFSSGSTGGFSPFYSAANLIESLKIAAIQQQQQQQQQQQFLQLTAAMPPSVANFMTSIVSPTKPENLSPSPTNPTMSSTPKLLKKRPSKRPISSAPPPPPPPAPPPQPLMSQSSRSPVKGTVIRALSKSSRRRRQMRQNKELARGDKDSESDVVTASDFVEITPEARAELAKIVNIIGDFVCQLCLEKFVDAFQLAKHRCPCIECINYPCPDCDKTFNCSANLASHRRWHKPKQQSNGNSSSSSSSSSNSSSSSETKKLPSLFSIDSILTSTNLRHFSNSESNPQQSAMSSAGNSGLFVCTDCGRSFKRAAYLRKHQLGCGGCVGADNQPNVSKRIDFKCGLCDSGFSVHTEFENHMLDHLMSKAVKETV